MVPNFFPFMSSTIIDALPLSGKLYSIVVETLAGLGAMNNFKAFASLFTVATAVQVSVADRACVRPSGFIERVTFRAAGKTQWHRISSYRRHNFVTN